MMKYFPALVLVLVACTSPNSESETPSAVQQVFTAEEASLKQVALSFEDTGISYPNKALGLISQGDYLFVVPKETAYLLDVYRLPDLRYVGKVGNRGKGPLESLSAFSMLLKDSATLWAYDVTLNKLLTLDLNGAANAEGIIPATEERFLGDSFHISHLLQNHAGDYVATSSTEADYRYYALNEDFEKVAGYGALPALPASWPDDVPKDLGTQIYQGKLLLHPTQNWYAFVYISLDRMDFYRNDTLYRSVVGPIQIEQKTSLFVNDDGKYEVAFTSNTLVSYYGMQALEAGVFGAFSGNTIMKQCGEEGYLIAWDGTPAVRFSFGETLCKITCYQMEDEIVFVGVSETTGNLTTARVALADLEG